MAGIRRGRVGQGQCPEARARDRRTGRRRELASLREGRLDQGGRVVRCWRRTSGLDRPAAAAGHGSGARVRGGHPSQVGPGGGLVGRTPGRRGPRGATARRSSGVPVREELATRHQSGSTASTCKERLPITAGSGPDPRRLAVDGQPRPPSGPRRRPAPGRGWTGRGRATRSRPRFGGRRGTRKVHRWSRDRGHPAVLVAVEGGVVAEGAEVVPDPRRASPFVVRGDERQGSSARVAGRLHGRPP